MSLWLATKAHTHSTWTEWGVADCQPTKWSWWHGSWLTYICKPSFLLSMSCACIQMKKMSSPMKPHLFCDRFEVPLRIQSCERLSDGLVHSSVKCCCLVGKSSWKSHRIIFKQAHVKEGKKKKKNILSVCQLSGSVLSQCFFVSLGMLFVVKILKDERYVVISLPFLRLFCIIIYCVSALSLHIESTNCMISSQLLTHIIIH